FLRFSPTIPRATASGCAQPSVSYRNRARLAMKKTSLPCHGHWLSLVGMLCHQQLRFVQIELDRWGLVETETGSATVWSQRDLFIGQTFYSVLMVAVCGVNFFFASRIHDCLHPSG